MVTFCTAIAACHSSDGKQAPVSLPKVRVVALAPHPIAPRIPIAGVLAPLPGKDVKVGALVAGRIDQIFVAEGDGVKLGQALAHVEAEPLRQHLVEAQAALESAKAALSNARTRLARAEKLFSSGIAAKQEVDDARAAAIAQESALAQAQAGGGLAMIQLDRATLRAPIAGVVAAILIPAGQPVDGGGTPVVEVADPRVLDLRAPVPAARIAEVTIGQKGRLRVEGQGELEGVVVAIAPLVDLATNTITVRVRIMNPSGRLRGGMYARGVLVAVPRLGLAVARSALLPGDGGAASTVAVVTDAKTAAGEAVHRIERVSVRLGAELGDEVEVLGGVAAGARVAVDGAYSLPDDAEVEVLP